MIYFLFVSKGGSEFTYQKLMTLWLNHEVSRTSRLLLVLDTAKSNFWVPLVRKTTAAHIGEIVDAYGGLGLCLFPVGYPFLADVSIKKETLYSH